VYVNNVRKSFTLKVFDPSKQTVRQFIGKLQNWANRISTAERSINEDEIHEKLLNSLLSNSLWQTAKMFCLRQSLGLKESINLLSSNETPIVPKSAASTKSKEKEKGGREGRKDAVKKQSTRHNSRQRRRNLQSPSCSRSCSQSCSPCRVY
jgi:hypothetical protein